MSKHCTQCGAIYTEPACPICDGPERVREKMETKLRSVRLVEESPDIPAGTYKGVWGGYKVSFEVDTVSYEGETESGVRGMNIPCSGS